MYTNYRRIRQEAGFYNESQFRPLLGNADGVNTAFFVDPTTIGDRNKFVNTIGSSVGQFGVSLNDVQAFYGLSGILGFSSVSISAINPLTGAITFTVAPPSGASVVATFVSSSVDDDYIKNYQGVAESAINNALGKAFVVPLEKRVLEVEDLATKLAAAYVLIHNHGVNAPDTSEDGYRLLDYVLGLSDYSGRIYALAKQGFLIAEDGTTIEATKEDGQVTGSNEYSGSGKNGGQLFTINQEQFRFVRPDGSQGERSVEDEFWGG